ncbi:MAG: hypothetical protein K0Q94_335 [Paenibacillus sp.]|nr:hypothetical protein [Paenibacillus sp.]
MWKSRAGTVSISLVLLIAPLFAFHSVLIDSARVKMAERQTEIASKAALRSVLSAYDPVLQTYGLYGLGISPEQSSELFAQVLEQNLSPGGGGTFRLVEASPVSESLKPLYTLANSAVFERQVLEEMKYRAPVEFTLNVTDKLLNGSKATSMLSGLSKFTEQAGKIEELIVEREKELDGAWAKAQEIAEKASIYRNYYAVKLGRLDELSRLIGLRQAEEVRGQIQTIRSQAEALNRTITERKASMAELIRAGVQAAEVLAAMSQSISELERSAAQLYAQIDELERILLYIAEYTLLLPATKMEAKRDQVILTEQTQAVFQTLDRAKALDDRIREEMGGLPADSGIAPETLHAATMPDAYYIAYKTGLGGISAMFSGFESALDATTLFAGDTRFDSVRMEILSESNDAYAGKAVQFLNEQRAEEERRTAQTGRIAQLKRQEQERYAHIWDQVRKIWADCGGGTEEAYKALTDDSDSANPSFYRKYMDYNRVSSSETSGVEELGSAEEAKERTKGTIDKLLGGLANAAGQFRDEMYINEYALTKFNYRTYGKETGKDGVLKPDYERSGRASHELPNQEAEYLLYGLNSCLKNQSAAYTEMFTLRLAVRTAEALMSPEAKIVAAGSPLLTILWAIAEGGVKAYSDMTKLVNGEEVPVSDKLPDTVTMNYKDYLRLFLLLHTKREPMNARMQSLIELNTGTDLRETPVYMQARTETKVRLWFMPYSMSLFGYPVEGRQAAITKTAALSY